MSLVRKIRNLGVVAAMVVLIGCDSKADNAPQKPATPVVRVANVQSDAKVAEIQGVGTAAWRRETMLGFTTGGQIARIFVNEGDQVRRGQLLALLDTTTVQAELTAAQADAARAASNAERLASLYRSGWVTKAQIEGAQASAQSSAALVSARRFAMATARIVAPSNGIVLARLAESKQIVAAGVPVLTMGEADGGYVIRVPLNDRSAAAIGRGAAARIVFEALGPEPLIGRVLEVGGKARQTTGTFDVEIGLPADLRLRSGMIGSAAITASMQLASPSVTVPATAILSPRAGEALVYVIDADNRARLRTVGIGETTDTGVAILSGLTGTEVVAVSGFEKLKDGIEISRDQSRR